MRKLVEFMAPLIDIAVLPIVLLAGLALKFVRRLGIGRLPRARRLFRALGVYPIRNHYYEPLFETNTLRRPLEEDRELTAVDLNVSGQLELLKNFSYNDELVAFPMNRESELSFYYDNNAFGPGDAEIFYNIIRHAKPGRIIEIGSGHSTLMARNAIMANEADDSSYKCRHICIEPYENAWLKKLDIELIRTPVERVDLSVFAELEANDILFIDSSHMIRPQGDVLFEYLELLPILNPGVFVHIHDIRTPKDYWPAWLNQEMRFWNEQYLVEAFLSFNSQYEVVAALNFLKHHHPTELAESCPVFGKRTDFWEPGSLWIRRV